MLQIPNYSETETRDPTWYACSGCGGWGGSPTLLRRRGGGAGRAQLLGGSSSRHGEVVRLEATHGMLLADVHAGAHSALAVHEERQAERQVCAAWDRKTGQGMRQTLHYNRPFLQPRTNFKKPY